MSAASEMRDLSGAQTLANVDTEVVWLFSLGIEITSLTNLIVRKTRKREFLFKLRAR